MLQHRRKAMQILAIDRGKRELLIRKSHEQTMPSAGARTLTENWSQALIRRRLESLQLGVVGERNGGRWRRKGQLRNLYADSGVDRRKCRQEVAIEVRRVTVPCIQ